MDEVEIFYKIKVNNISFYKNFKIIVKGFSTNDKNVLGSVINNLKDNYKFKHTNTSPSEGTYANLNELM